MSDTTELKKATEKIVQEVEKCKLSAKSLERKTESLQLRLLKAEKEIDYLMNKDRIKNLVFYGIEEDSNSDATIKMLNIFSAANISIKKEEIDSCRRLGNNEGTRPLLVTFKQVSSKKQEASGN